MQWHLAADERTAPDSSKAVSLRGNASFSPGIRSNFRPRTATSFATPSVGTGSPLAFTQLGTEPPFALQSIGK